MTVHLEIELKWALSGAVHDRLALCLRDTLGAPRALAQDNRFFDSADARLRRAGLNLRLRRENERLLMTCKRKVAGSPDGAHRHEEWEEWLPPTLWDDLIHPAADLAAQLPLPEPLISALGNAPLLSLGGFVNQRSEFDHQESGLHELLCLDRTDFSGRTDFELEIETCDPSTTSARWAAQLKKWELPFAVEPLTKFARFLALLT